MSRPCADRRIGRARSVRRSQVFDCVHQLDRSDQRDRSDQVNRVHQVNSVSGRSNRRG